MLKGKCLLINQTRFKSRPGHMLHFLKQRLLIHRHHVVVWRLRKSQ